LIAALDAAVTRGEAGAQADQGSGAASPVTP
jgi:hypothetical protein